MAERTCDLEDCEDAHLAQGYCNKHYHRWRKTGDPRATKQIRDDIEARFWSWVDRRGDDECWPWRGLLVEGGYAHFTVGGKRVSAHRWAYARFVRPIPDGYTVDHVKANGCTRRDCTNFVQHLESVTMRVNVLRGDGPSAQNARKTYCKNGHEFTPENTIIRSNGNRACRQCARDRALRYYHRQRAKRKEAGDG